MLDSEERRKILGSRTRRCPDFLGRRRPGPRKLLEPSLQQTAGCDLLEIIRTCSARVRVRACVRACVCVCVCGTPVHQGLA